MGRTPGGLCEKLTFLQPPSDSVMWDKDAQRAGGGEVGAEPQREARELRVSVPSVLSSVLLTCCIFNQIVRRLLMEPTYLLF